MSDEIRSYVTTLRMRRGFTKQTLAYQTGVSRSLISQYENNKTNISDDTLNKIISVLSKNERECKSHLKYINKIKESE